MTAAAAAPASSTESEQAQGPTPQQTHDMDRTSPRSATGSAGDSSLFQRTRAVLPTVPTAESVTKWTAVVVLLIYGFGFLITSLHYAAYGFFELTPFKPRVIAAGTWFLIFAGLLIFMAMKLWPEEATLTDQLVEILWVFWIVYYAADFIGGKIFDYADPIVTFGTHRWTGLPGNFPVPIFTIIVLLIARLAQRRKLSGLAIACALIGVLVISFFAIMSSQDGLTYPFLAFELCFFSYLSRFYLDATLRKRNNELQWILILAFVLSGIAGFGTSLYPHIKAAWGGGSLVPVAVYLSKDSRINPGGEFSGYLIDESEVGIYVTKGKDQHALFLPRSAISSVFYSDKPLTPEYLGLSSTASSAAVTSPKP